MRSIKLIFWVLIVSFVFAQDLSRSYQKLTVDLYGAPVLGQNVTLNVRTILPKVKYIYAGFDSGESYFLTNKNGEWRTNFSIPYYFAEGKKNFSVVVVMEAMTKSEYENLKYLYRDIPNIVLEQHVDLTMMKISEDLLVLGKETLRSGLNIEVFPREVQPGQKVNLSVQLPQLLQKATLVYAGKSIALNKESDTRWSGTFIAGKESRYKLYLLSLDNKLQVQTGELLIVPEERFALPVSSTIESVPTKQVTNPKKDNFTIKGNKTIVFINKSKEGDVNFTEEHRREESLNLDIAGREGSVNVEAKIFSTTQENVDKKEDIRIRLYEDYWEAYLGDFTQTCTENEFTFRNKNLSGFRFSYYPGRTYAMVLTATERGTDRLEYIYGNDSQGPYYLAYSPVVIGSEKIYLDGELQLRDVDYVIENKSGKITFRGNVVQSFQLIKVLYESEKETLRSKYSALRLRQDFGWLALGFSGLQKLDPYEVADNERNPQEIKLYGVDAKIKLGYLKIELEEAKEDINQNILDKGATLNIAQAHYKKLSYDDLRILKFSTSTKLTDLDFDAIGNSDLRRGLEQAENELELKATANNVYLRGEQLKEKYQEDAIYKNYNGYYKFYRLEDHFPEIRYWVKENNRKITTIASGNRVLQTSYHAENVELSKILTANIRLGIRGGREDQEDLDSLDYPYKKAESYGAFVKTEGIKGFDLLFGADRQESKYLTEEKRVSLDAQRNETYSKINFYPDQHWRTGLAYREIKDTYSGNSEIMDLDYTVIPDQSFSTIGQYSLTSLKETYVSQSYRVQKQKGTFSMKYQPFNFLRTTLRYNPNISIVHAERDVVNSSAELKNANVDITPWHNVALKYNYQNSHAYTKDPAYNFILSSEDLTLSDIAVLKLTPHDKVDLEFRSRYTRKIDNDLNDTNTMNMFYTDGEGYETEQGAAIYMRWTRELLLSLDYNRLHQVMDYKNAPSLNIKFNEDKYGFDAKYKYDMYWTYHLFGSYARRENLLVSQNNITYEYSPGAGVAYRLINMKLSYDYTYIETTMGEELLRHKHDLSFTYDLNNFISFVTNAEHIDSIRPRYKTTDVLVKMSATF